MKVASKVAPLCERLACLELDTLLALANVEEARESTVDVRVDVLPGLHVEDRVAL